MQEDQTNLAKSVRCKRVRQIAAKYQSI